MREPETMSGDEWLRKKLEIDTLLNEYEDNAKAAIKWYLDYKARNSGFRCVRRNGETK